MTNRSILTIENLTKRFGKFTAVDSISFSVREGEILGLLGANGAGKTTTLSMIMGILAPTSGNISIFGKDFHLHREEILSQTNYASAYTKAPWRLTVIEHLSVFADIYDIPRKSDRINELISIFNLTKHKNKWCGDLSAGNMAKLNLAKAFINNPRLLLLDEPTSSKDPDIASDVRQFILKAQETLNTTVIITSHNMAEIDELCDRVIFMAGGKIVAEDTPEGLARQITTARITLLMRDGQKRTVEYCKKHRYAIDTKERMVTITLPEEKIAQFLSEIGALGVSYAEISIDKPTLVDFFIAHAKKTKDTSILKQLDKEEY